MSTDDLHALEWLDAVNFVEHSEGEQAEDDGNEAPNDAEATMANADSPMNSEALTDETTDDLTKVFAWLQSIHFVEHHDGDTVDNDIGDDDSDTSGNADHTHI
jgi:hypothetical protein